MEVVAGARVVAVDVRVVRVVFVAALVEFTAAWFSEGTGVLTLI